MIAALKITSGAQTDSWKSTGAHGVGRFIVFMCLAVSTKGGTAMIFVREAMAQDNFMQAIVCRNTVGDGEIIELHCDEVKEMNQHDPRCVCVCVTETPVGVGRLQSRDNNRIARATPTWLFSY